MKTIIDIKKLKNWIGKKETVSDVLTSSLEQKFRATLDIEVKKPQDGEVASSGIHWALAPPIIRSSELGKDSHALRGTFLPPVPLPRRMWAGCQTTFYSNFFIGDEVVRESSIFDVSLKEGKTGQLCFVKVKHEFFVAKKKILEEIQDIVYRDMGKSIKRKKTPPLFNENDLEEEIFTHPTLLFRYSAITFNGHRIHYDYEYSRKEEKYKNLVFHGPLQATFLLRISEKLAKKRVKNFKHVGITPVFANEKLKIMAKIEKDNQVVSWTSTEKGGVTMRANAQF